MNINKLHDINVVMVIRMHHILEERLISQHMLVVLLNGVKVYDVSYFF